MKSVSDVFYIYLFEIFKVCCCLLKDWAVWPFCEAERFWALLAALRVTVFHPVHRNCLALGPSARTFCPKEGIIRLQTWVSMNSLSLHESFIPSYHPQCLPGPLLFLLRYGRWMWPPQADSMDLGFFGHPLCKHDFVISRQAVTAILLNLPNRYKTKSHEKSFKKLTIVVWRLISC